MFRARDSLLTTLFLCAGAAQAQFSSNLWPTTNVFRFGSNVVQTVSNVPLLVFQETTTECRATGDLVYATSYFRTLDASPWSGRTQSWERVTNFFEQVAGVNTNTDPFGEPAYTGLVWAVTTYTYRVWATNTPALRLQARDLACWEAWQAMVERDLAVPPVLPGITSAPPAFYRSLRANLIAQKAWIENRACDFVIPTGASNLLAAGSNALPRWTAAGLLASNSLPADYLTTTPRRALIGEGTNRYGYNGIRACLTNLVWTDASVVWTNGLGLERQAYSCDPDTGLLYGFYTNWADAAMDYPTATTATNGAWVKPARGVLGAISEAGPLIALSSARAAWKARLVTTSNAPACVADLWLQAAPFGGYIADSEWYGNGDSWASGVLVSTDHVFAVSVTKTNGGFAAESQVVPDGGSLSEGELPPEPTGGQPLRAKGWVTSWAYWVIRWDVTNGFRFR